MPRSESEQMVSGCNFFDRKAFKINIWNVDSVCFKNKEISILSVFHCEICQFNIWQHLPSVEELVCPCSETDKTQIYQSEE